MKPAHRQRGTRHVSYARPRVVTASPSIDEGLRLTHAAVGMKRFILIPLVWLPLLALSSCGSSESNESDSKSEGGASNSGSGGTSAGGTSAGGTSAGGTSAGGASSGGTSVATGGIPGNPVGRGGGSNTAGGATGGSQGGADAGAGNAGEGGVGSTDALPVPPNTLLDDLSETQKAAICDWNAELLGGYGHVDQCGMGPRVFFADQAECTLYAFNWDCEWVTVQNFVNCAVAQKASGGCNRPSEQCSWQFCR